MVASRLSSVRDEIICARIQEFKPRDECWCCARLKLDLKRAILELESATEIIRILTEEILGAALEVRNSTNGGYSNDSGSDFPHDGDNQMQERGNRQSEIAEEVKVKFKDNNLSI
jgi:hypothetical protein